MNKIVLFNHETFSVEQWSVSEILAHYKSPTARIQIMPPEFQRDFVASLEWQRDLVDSFYNGLSSNLIHFRKLDAEKSSKTGYGYQCISPTALSADAISLILMKSRFTHLSRIGWVEKIAIRHQGFSSDFSAALKPLTSDAARDSAPV